MKEEQKVYFIKKIFFFQDKKKSFQGTLVTRILMSFRIGSNVVILAWCENKSGAITRD
jgi:hypothetical protein